MNKRKLINDPIYGFIQFPYELLYEIIDHPYIQRLRRISQMGLTHLIYPGAVHTRFHHTLGALHLMTTAIDTLRNKGVDITEEEALATSIAILMHDIGHGPFSHALEHTIIQVSHEFLSIQFMKELEDVYGDPITLALKIFQNEYPKHFLHQLVSSQLDMDRMDYLSRDSFYTGVVEGVIGYDRIIKMLQVKDNELVVEAKGIHSIEKFLVARRIMYWQVYLHKTSVSAESMLKRLIVKIKEELTADKNSELFQILPENLTYFLSKNLTTKSVINDRKVILERFSDLDEYDIYYSLKKLSKQKSGILAYLSTCILERKLFKVKVKDEEFTDIEIHHIKSNLLKDKGLDIKNIEDVIILKNESNISYNIKKESIKILTKENEVIPINKYSKNLIDTQLINKYFLCFPHLYS